MGVVKAGICAIVNLIFNVNIYVIFFLIHYFQLDHDAPCLPQKLPLFPISPWYNSRPKRNPRQWLWTILGRKQGALWST